MKSIKQFIQMTDDLADPLRRGFLAKIDEVEKKLVHMSKDEAIEFAEKYLEVRKDDIVAFPTNLIMSEENVNKFKEFEKRERVWNIAAEYILLDIIPYIYGEALD